jgi:hypothetical protein
MLLCMRTTLDINDSLFVQAKKKAVEEGVPLRQIVEDALRGYLQGPAIRRRYRFRGGTDSGRLLPGIDLDDRNSLFDAMEGRK